MNSPERLLYSRKDACQMLSLSMSSVDQLILTGRLRVRRKGKRVLILRSELERLARTDLSRIWPSKLNGKTTRHFSTSLSQNPEKTEVTAHPHGVGTSVPELGDRP